MRGWYEVWDEDCLQVNSDASPNTVDLTEAQAEEWCDLKETGLRAFYGPSVEIHTGVWDHYTVA